MKLKSKLILFATLMVAMVLSFSCSENEGNGPTPPDGEVQAIFSTDIELSVVEKTRVDGDKWEVDDEVGIYMVQHGTTLPAGLVSGVANRKYKVLASTTDAKDVLKPATNDDGIYFPMDASTVDFIAYYPYKPSSELVNFKYPINLATQTAPSKHDLIYSTGGTGNSYNNAVTLSFNHMLSNITLDISRGHGITDDKFQAKTVSVNGTPATASFFLGDGKLSDIGAVAPITATSKNAAGTLYEIIVLPHTVGSYKGRYVNIAFDGKDFQWYIPDGIEIEQGKRYVYQMNLTANGLEMTNFSIEPWENTTDIGGQWGTGTSEIKFKPDDIERVLIPAGKFWMGTSDGNTEITINGSTFKPARDPNQFGDGREQPIHEVQISNDFYLGKYEVTSEQYCYFLNSFRGDPNLYVSINGTATTVYRYVPDVGWQVLAGSDTGNYPWMPYYNQKTGVWSPAYDAVTDTDYSKYPATGVSYYGAKAFCEWVGGRLPTEAEWEYACYGGRYFETYTDGAFPIRWDITGGTTSYSNLIDYAWFGLNNTPETSGGWAKGAKPVGTRAESTYKLHDMHGNAWEWCSDWYLKDYYKTIAGSLAVDPTGPTDDDMELESAKNSVLRGGCVNDNFVYQRTVTRHTYPRSSCHNLVGFRVLFPKN